MAEPITMQGLIDASIDADTLGEFANEDKTVVSRNGLEYPSAPMASRLLVENGLLGATPFSTYAAMTTSSLTQGSYAIVTNDTDQMNGVYKRDGGAFVRQSYSPSSDIAKLVKIVSGTGAENLVEFADSEGVVYMLADSMGNLKLAGLDDNVQSLLIKSKQTARELENTANIAGQSGMAMMLVDDDDKLIFAVKNNGQFVTSAAKPLSIKREYYIKPAANYHNPLQQVAAPVPLNFIPLDFNAPAELLSLRITQPIATKVDTIYYTDDGVVHPNILDFYSGINGHQYWLGITPYHLNNDDFENPFVYTSDDLKSFALNNDFAQPLADQPNIGGDADAYNSDVFFTYDFNSGEIVCGWRTSIRGVNKGTALYCRRTRDGINWSDKELLFDTPSGHSVLSPSIVYDFATKKYYLFCVDGESAGVYGIARYESDSITGNWTNRIFSVFDKSVIDPWHLDVRYVGKQLVCIINDNFTTHTLYLGMSSDMGATWDVSDAIITGVHQQAYKATFTPIYNGNQMALQVIWTSDQSDADATKRWNLFSAQTNFITIAGV